MFSGCPHQIRQQEVHEGGGASRLAGRGRAEAGQEAARESVDRNCSTTTTCNVTNGTC